jgi:hypothetical protein
MQDGPKLSHDDLAHFTGSEQCYRHGINPRVRYTEGTKYLADAGGAYWLLDAIAIAQRFERAVAIEEFQVWILRVHDDRSATLSCEDGNSNKVFEQQIPWTDFPLDQVKLYYTDGVILLPSEY